MQLQYSSVLASKYPAPTRRSFRALFATLCSAALSAAALAQGREIIVKDATLLVGDGTALEGAALVVRGEKFANVGGSPRGGPMSRTVNAKGKYITPGLIDAWSTIALAGGDQNRGGRAIAADAFDRFDRNAIEAALKQGVTTVFLPARTNSGIGGIGSVVRLLPDGATSDQVLREEAALCAALGLDPRMPPLARAKAFGDFRKAWIDARQYRKALESYEEDLKEYEEKIKKRAEENKNKPPGEKKDEAKEEKKEEKPEERPATPPPDRPRPPRPDGRPPRRPDRGPRPEAPPAEAPKEEGKKEESKDAIKKPAEPAKDPTKEALLKAIDGKLPVQIEAHRPDDILNAIDIATNFNLAVMVAGGSGAAPIAKELNDAGISVILASEPPAMQYNPGVERDAAPGTARKLIDSGVRVALGSGPAGGEGGSRHLALSASRLVGEGIASDRALQTITGDAAAMLGLGDQIGTLASGHSADFVVWSAHPFSPDARVEQVFIRGREVYKAGQIKPADDKDVDEPATEPATSKPEGEPK